jgi:sec-independent protein translocase protein TatC
MSEQLSFFSHFDELRRRIFHSLWGFGICFALCSVFTGKVANFVFLPYYKYLPKGAETLAYTNISEVFFLYMKMVAIVALFISSPWIFYQLWLFISPALRQKEKRLALPFIMGTTFFMMAGMVFSYLVVLPFTFRFFFNFNEGYRNVVTVSSIWNFELLMIIGIGLSFESPVLIFLLTRLHIVTPKTLFKFSRWAILLAFIISAVITPSGDPFTQTIVALPIVVLYFLGILLAMLFPVKKENAE